MKIHLVLATAFLALPAFAADTDSKDSAMTRALEAEVAARRRAGRREDAWEAHREELPSRFAATGRKECRRCGGRSANEELPSSLTATGWIDAGAARRQIFGPTRARREVRQPPRRDYDGSGQSA